MGLMVDTPLGRAKGGKAGLGVSIYIYIHSIYIYVICRMHLHVHIGVASASWISLPAYPRLNIVNIDCPVFLNLRECQLHG